MKMYVAINIFYIFANPAQCALVRGCFELG